MKEQKNFFERYQPVFEIVCRILGNGWRVNLLDDCQYRIKLRVNLGFSSVKNKD